MKIWCTEIGEPLPMEKDARLHRYGLLTRYLASAGHEVVWWTSNFSHAPKSFVAEGGKDYRIEGVTLKVLQGLGYKRNVSFSRIRHQKHFAEKFYKAAKELPSPEIVLSSLPTIEAAGKAVRFGRATNVPVLIDIADAWPDELVDLAPAKLRWLARLFLLKAYQEMKFVCMHATGILSICQSYLDYGLSFARRDANAYDGIFPLGYSSSSINSIELDAAKKWWEEQGVTGKPFTCCFFGTIGKFFQLDTVIQAAKKLTGKLNIQFVLCGDGSSLASYKQKATRIKSVIFPGWVDAPKIAALMAVSDVGLAPYAEGTRMSLPNKPFEYFAGGLPVVSSIQGELKEILASAGSGLTYHADSVDELCACIMKLYTSERLRKDSAERAKSLFEEKYTTELIFSKLNQHLIDVAKNFRKANNL